MNSPEEFIDQYIKSLQVPEELAAQYLLDIDENIKFLAVSISLSQMTDEEKKELKEFAESNREKYPLKSFKDFIFDFSFKKPRLKSIIMPKLEAYLLAYRQFLVDLK
jgi:hypothetical protein